MKKILLLALVITASTAYSASPSSAFSSKKRGGETFEEYLIRKNPVPQKVKKKKRKESFEDFLERTERERAQSPEGVQESFKVYQPGSGKVLEDFEPTYSHFSELPEQCRKDIVRSGSPFLDDRLAIVAAQTSYSSLSPIPFE